jgi:hypothetical protein
MILWLSTKEFSNTLPKMSPPEMWSPTLNFDGLKSHLISRERAWVLIPPAPFSYLLLMPYHNGHTGNVD